MTIHKNHSKAELRSKAGHKSGEFDEVRDARKKLKQAKFSKKLRSRK